MKTLQNNNKPAETITWEEAWEATNDSRHDEAMDRIADTIINGGYDRYLQDPEGAKAVLVAGECLINWSSENPDGDYILEKINNEEFDVVSEWIHAEGYELSE